MYRLTALIGTYDVSVQLTSWPLFFQILPLAQDKWLLDTYLNASGHIR
jgi:acyl-coenzyme A thioesterase 9